MRFAGEARGREMKHFTAPGLAVGAETHAVKRDAAGGSRNAVFRHHGADMGPVMLHGVGRDPALKLNPVSQTRGEEVRVQVMRHQFGRDFKHRFEMLHRELERLTGTRVPEVTDMLREESFAAAGQAGSDFKSRTGRENRRRVKGKRHRFRRIAAGAPHHAGFIRHHPDNRVIAADENLAVIRENEIRNAAEALQRFIVSDHKRLSARIRARHHECPGEHAAVKPLNAIRPSGSLVEEEQMHGGIGEHHAEFGESRGYALEFSVAERCLFGENNRSRDGFKGFTLEV